MRLSFQRALFLVLTLACTLFALRPIRQVDLAFEFGLSPLRPLLELVWPLFAIGTRPALAAQERDTLELADRDARARLIEAEQHFTLPQDPAHLAGRRFVRGEVLGRDARSLDRLIVAVESGRTDGLRPGMPVVSGDIFVGRVGSIEAGLGRIQVDLITQRDFVVGGLLVDPGGQGLARLCAGGLANDRVGAAGELFLAVAAPQTRALTSGRVVVEEVESSLDPFAREARGFEIGVLGSDSRGRDVIVPRVDYQDGLFHVAVAAPADLARPAETPLSDLLAEANWVDARVLSPTHPGAERAGGVLALGSTDGIEHGAAVIDGSRLVGRISARGRWSSKVAWLSDPGFSIPLVAVVEGLDRPWPLGRITMLADLGGGRVRVRWEARTAVPPTPAAVEREAELFTGGGESGVPRGLAVGSASLPAGRTGRLEFELELCVQGGRTADLRAWIEPKSSAGSP